MEIKPQPRVEDACSKTKITLFLKKARISDNRSQTLRIKLFLEKNILVRVMLEQSQMLPIEAGACLKVLFLKSFSNKLETILCPKNNKA